MDVEDDSLEFQYFKKFLTDYPQLEAYRTEWTVYYEEIRLSGSIDMVFRDTNTGEFLIYDWKRVKEIEYESKYGKSALPDFISDLPDSNFWHYSLQLNTYRKILQDKYNMKISGLFLIVLHPDNFYKTYERIELPILDDTINKLWEYRKKQLEENTP
jgi:ATP-dependent exoDNAse (exonuclease V) beta subunit